MVFINVYVYRVFRLIGGVFSSKNVCKLFFRRVIFHSSCHLLGGLCEKMSISRRKSMKIRFCLKVNLLLGGYKKGKMYVNQPAIRRDLGLCLFFFISSLSLLLCTYRNGSNQTNDSTNEERPCTHDPLNLAKGEGVIHHKKRALHGEAVLCCVSVCCMYVVCCVYVCM